ncbi:hypothetical protein ScalyP_jg5990 [Parmales sp. scaly parma]|nr:hypothetical protein ScalyP_jg5990 [Parmales sp. scaly parma]|tara:strand:+ start:135 stop:506 length:372 start_codon:yes stop_codon:yes gene_type:complete
MASSLSRLVLLVRGGTTSLSQSIKFFNTALSLPLTRQTDDWAELTCPKSNISITLQATSNEALLSSSYSPILQFEVAELSETVTKCLAAGANLDGPIQYKAHGAVAQLRSPSGVMVGLYEPVA